MTHSYVWYDSFICVTWLIHICDMTHTRCIHVGPYIFMYRYSYSRSSFICVTWLIHMCKMTHSYVCDMTHTRCIQMGPISLYINTIALSRHSYVWHDSFVCVTWLIPMCDMTHSMCDMTHSYVWHDSFICVNWLIHICDMTHSYVWHESFHVTYSSHMVHTHVALRTRMWHAIMMLLPAGMKLTWSIHMWHDTLVRDMQFEIDIVHFICMKVTLCLHMWHDALVRDMQLWCNDFWEFEIDIVHFICMKGTWCIQMWHDALVGDMQL